MRLVRTLHYMAPLLASLVTSACGGAPVRASTAPTAARRRNTSHTHASPSAVVLNADAGVEADAEMATVSRLRGVSAHAAAGEQVIGPVDGIRMETGPEGQITFVVPPLPHVPGTPEAVAQAAPTIRFVAATTAADLERLVNAAVGSGCEFDGVQIGAVSQRPLLLATLHCNTNTPIAPLTQDAGVGQRPCVRTPTGVPGVTILGQPGCVDVNPTRDATVAPIHAVRPMPTIALPPLPPNSR